MLYGDHDDDDASLSPRNLSMGHHTSHHGFKIEIEKMLNEEFEWNRDFLDDWQVNESSTAESVELILEQVGSN